MPMPEPGAALITYAYVQLIGCFPDEDNEKFKNCAEDFEILINGRKSNLQVQESTF